MQPNIVLFDIDNTLADMDHRLHYLERESIDWNEFEEQCIYDQPIMPAILCVHAWRALGKQIWCWSGRSTHIQQETEHWLRTNGVPYHQLLLRSPEKARDEPTETTKLGWLQSVIPRDRVICAFDDDARVVDVLRKQGGLLVFQVRRAK